MTKKTKTTENFRQDEHMIYVGPSLSGGRLSFATIYIGGYPQHLTQLLTENPWLKQLFVPVSGMNAAIVETHTKGALLNILYERAKEV